MSIVVFAGPTLGREEILSRLDAVVLGPAAFGDVYRAAHGRPSAIAIIDGYFERVPATWHKEVLWAMSEGVHVFGASSMGALRAAELCDFGMVGVGSIFEAFRDGVLEDDDEVAVAHATADAGYKAISEAMVNIRATLQRATDVGIVSSETAHALRALAKQSFYAERSYATLLEAGAQQGLAAAELASLASWLKTGRIDQKRADALQLLEHLQAWQVATPKPMRVSYSFAATDAWHEAQRIASEGLSESASSSTSSDEALLEELKLSGGYAQAHAAAAVRGWSLEAARRAGMKPDALAVRSAVETFRRDQGLTERQAFEGWRQAQRFDDASLTRFFEDQARSAWAEPLTETLGRAQLKSQLQASSAYGELAERAELKAKSLSELGLTSPALSDAGLSDEDLWRWYFAQLKHGPPRDLESFARGCGFSGAEELRRAALREYCHRHRTPPRPDKLR